MTDPMTHDELKACRERAEAATAGPWEVSRRDEHPERFPVEWWRAALERRAAA